MSNYFCTNKDCRYYLKPCPITFDVEDDGYAGPILCEWCQSIVSEYGGEE